MVGKRNLYAYEARACPSYSKYTRRVVGTEGSFPDSSLLIALEDFGMAGERSWPKDCPFFIVMGTIELDWMVDCGLI